MKLGDEFGQKRHCPGVNGCMVVSGELIVLLEDVGAELASGLNDRLIVKVDRGAVVVAVVVVVVTSIDGLKRSRL